MFGIKKKLGFGCMRMKMDGKKVDYGEFSKMVDAFLENGFNYFDTAHGYLDGESEVALRECLTSRYPRDAYILTDKLSTHHFKTNEEIRPLFERQLEILGVDYLDFYLMHAQDAKIYKKYQKCGAYETAMEFLKEGKIKHFGISFHDKAEVLEQILTEHPEIEVVQIQFNYIDFEDASVQSRKVYEVCRRFNKPVIVMEPVKGGNLVRLPDEAKKIFDDLGGGSYASYAIRFAAGFEGIMTVLSGMGDMDMMNDNISYMKDFKPLDEREREAVSKVCDIFRAQDMIPCTDCRYCMAECPKGLSIPNMFACLNAKKTFGDWNSEYYYHGIHTSKGKKASDCIKCGKCEAVCPQHLEIRELLKEVAKEFDKPKEK
ncbi:MAG: aldo/keto reductase [Clostridia bacterium]|nr:aldo/keto reductase [Clostridia bacterium]